eukprot:g28782.t1
MGFPPWPSSASTNSLASRAQVTQASVDSDAPAVTANGFRVLAENSSIEVEEQNVAPFSVPQEVLSFQPDDQAVFARFMNGDCERTKLHCNIELTADELEALRLLQEEARVQRVALPVSISASATRYLSHSHGDPKKALKMMEATTEWRSSYFTRPLSDVNMAEDLKLGLALRPVLVFRASRIPAAWHRERRYDLVIRVLVFSMEYFMRYMAVPGKIERRIFRFYICNMPRILGTLVPLAKKVLTERQRQKLVFVCKPEDITRDIASGQLEEDLGGERQQIKDLEFFPYPLLPGPFEPSEPPVRSRKDPVPGVHKLLTPDGFTGRLWNRRAKPEENRRLNYSECAADIFRKCGLPVPAEVLARTRPPEPESQTGSNEKANEPDSNVGEDPQPEAIVTPSATPIWRPWSYQTRTTDQSSRKLRSCTADGVAFSPAAVVLRLKDSQHCRYSAHIVETNETVAIKKVFVDRRYRNRELQVWREMHHPNIVTLKHAFYTSGDLVDELYLNMVMEYVPETVYCVMKRFGRPSLLPHIFRMFLSMCSRRSQDALKLSQIAETCLP